MAADVDKIAAAFGISRFVLPQNTSMTFGSDGMELVLSAIPDVLWSYDVPVTDTSKYRSVEAGYTIRFRGKITLLAGNNDSTIYYARPSE